jgi:hypothetical protein
MNVGGEKVVYLIVEEVALCGRKRIKSILKGIGRHTPGIPASPPSAQLTHHYDKPSNSFGSTLLDVIYTNPFACR